MTLAKIQPFVKKYGIELGYIYGKEVWPRTVKKEKDVYTYTIIISVAFGVIHPRKQLKQL